MYQMNAGRAEAGLDDGEDLRHRDAEGFGLVVGDVEEELGDVGRVGAEDFDQRRILVGVEHRRAGPRPALGRAPREVLSLPLRCRRAHRMPTDRTLLPGPCAPSPAAGDRT